MWELGLDYTESEVTAALKSGWTGALPACAAYRGQTELALGEDARLLRGRETRGVTVRFPVRDGYVSDEALLTKWARKLLQECAQTSRIRKPTLLFAMPPLGVSAYENAFRACVTACEAASGSACDRAVLALAGEGGDVLSCEGRMVVSLGEGCTDAAVIARGAVVSRYATSGGLAEADRALNDRLRRDFAIAVGAQSASELREQLASCKLDGNVTATCVGLNLRTGFPCAMEIPASATNEAVERLIAEAEKCARRAMSLLPEELAADIAVKPALLVGRGAAIPGIDSRLSDKIGLKCEIAQKPDACASQGLVRLLSEDALAPLARGL